jgi:hypothetical protein
MQSAEGVVAAAGRASVRLADRSRDETHPDTIGNESDPTPLGIPEGRNRRVEMRREIFPGIPGMRREDAGIPVAPRLADRHEDFSEDPHRIQDGVVDPHSRSLSHRLPDWHASLREFC